MAFMARRFGKRWRLIEELTNNMLTDNSSSVSSGLVELPNRFDPSVGLFPRVLAVC